MELFIDNVSKRYQGSIWGLRKITLTLKPGVLALLGPNGAGKSTLMRILATITKPTEGRVLWNNTDIVQSPNSLRSVLGYLPQDFGIYPNLNAQEFLEYIAALKGLGKRFARERIYVLLQMVNLFDVRRRPLGSYSTGMKQRLGIAQSLLNDPELLIVDEPTAGLDPQERVRFRNLLTSLADDRIVILSTHIVSDADSAATEIAVIKQGQLLKHGLPEQILNAVEGKVWQWDVTGTELDTIKQKYLISSSVRHNDRINLRIVADNPPVSTAKNVPATLEDAYLYLIGNATNAEESRS